MRSIKSRRLRKKLYLDEFAILGFEVSCSIGVETSDEFDLFLDQLVSFVEDNELIMGGGG
ncbi:MAG: 50S ribosome-binding protein YggL, partial [Colwellia sp.]